MDPYVVCKIDNTRHQTKTHNSGGKKPVWNQTFNYRISGNEKFATLAILDEDTFSSDFVGDTNEILVKDLKGGNSNKFNGEFDIKYK